MVRKTGDNQLVFTGFFSPTLKKYFENLRKITVKSAMPEFKNLKKNLEKKIRIKKSNKFFFKISSQHFNKFSGYGKKI